MFGTMVYGHAGGLNEFLSNLVLIPELGAGVFISQNGGARMSLPFPGPDLILAHLAAEAGLRPSEPQSVADADTRAADVAGRYIANRRAFTGPMQHLSPQVSVQALPDGAILAVSMRLAAVIRHDPIAPDIWQESHGKRIVAIRDDAGRVVRLMDGMGVMSHERARPANDPMLAFAGFGLSALLAPIFDARSELTARMTPAEAGFLDAMITAFLPVTQRRAGLANEGAAIDPAHPIDPTQVRAPVLILHAGDDRLTPGSTAQFTAEGIPGAETRILDTGGHLLLGHHSVVRERIAAFLATHVPAEAQ
jgi:pimeloyl-ACP methyl ester carboxylesterase